jgi:hypothetical protein
VIWQRTYERRDIVLALADGELMGQSFEEGKFRLSVGGFYRGELVDERNVPGLLEDATVVNAVGERAVAAVIAAGLATERAVKRVAGVPHVQVFVSFI